MKKLFTLHGQVSALLYPSTFIIFTLCWIIITPSFAQLRFNELSGDAGNNDGTNDGIVELINTTTSDFDASCYVISNGEWVVVLPPNTIIPAGGLFLVACSEGQNSGANPNPVPESGLTCATCDFPSMPIDFDVCDPANAAYVDWAASGFTIDNQGDTDGDQVVLFEPDGSIVQAAKWGGGATGGNDNTSVQTGAYTLGTSGSGGNGISSALLPSVLKLGGNCHNAGVNYIMPIITDAIYADLTNVLNPDGKTINNTVLQGCNSSFIYNTTTMTWSKTDHPNPGQPNDAAAYNFSLSSSAVQCAGTAQPVTVTLEVYNWQAVTPGVTNAKGGVGSFVSFDAGATIIAWDSYNRDNTTGITTLTYTFTPVGNQTLSLVWDDDKSSLFASTPTGSSSASSVVKNTTPSDCYVVYQIPAAIIQTLSVSDVNISCPSDFPNGTVNIGSLTTGGFNNTFELFDNNVSQGSNSTGIFAIPDNLNGPITVVVTDGAGCTAPITISINNNCRQAPICPSNLTYDACVTPSGNKCPEDIITLGLAATDLPAGGKVEWVQVTNANDDPYTMGTVVASAQINVSAIPSGSPKINEVLYDATTESGTTYGEGIEIAGTPGASLGCFIITDGDWAIQLPSTAQIPADGFYVIGSNSSDASWSSNIDLLLTAATNFPNLTNNGEFIGLYNASETLIDGVIWNQTSNSSNNTPNGQSVTYTTGSGCAAASPIAIADVLTAGTFTAGTYGGYTWVSANVSNERSIERANDGTGTWQRSANPGGTTNTMGATNGGTNPPTVSCVTYTIPSNACNSTLHIRPRIVPVDAACNNPTLAALSYDIACPTAVLSGGGTFCAPANGTAMIQINNGGNGNMISGNITDGTNDFAFSGATAADGTATINITNINIAGDYSIENISILNTCQVDASGTATIQINPAPDVALTGTAEVCAGLIARIPFTINAGTLPFIITYNIDGGASQSVEVFNNQLNIPTAGLAITNHNITIENVIDDNNCAGTATGAAMLTIHIQPVITPNLTQPTCTSAGFINFAALTGANFTYAYATNGGANFTTITPDAGNVTIPLAAGAQNATTYLIRVTNTDASPTCIADFMIATNAVTNCTCANPAIANAGDNQTVCGIVAVNLSATTNGTGSWSGGAGSFLDATNPTTPYTPDATEIGSTVTLTWTTADPDGTDICTAANDEVDIMFQALPTITLGSNPTVCQGTTTATLIYNTTTQNPDQYSLDFDSPLFNDIANQPLLAAPGSMIINIPADVPSDIYTATLTVRNSATTCVSQIYPITIYINAVNAGTIGNNQTVCTTKDPAPFTATPATATMGAVITYQWERSFEGCEGTFEVIADTELYDVPKGVLSKTAYFRRRAIAVLNDVSCEALSNCVTITVLSVDCGGFPWNGN